MIDSSTLYFIFSIVFLSLSLVLKNLKTNVEDIKIDNTKLQPVKKTNRGKKYLNFLFDQLSKSLLDTEKESKLLLKECKPEELVGEVYDASVIPFFTLVYATQSNTSKKFSERIMHEATTTLGLKCQIKNISELTVDDFKKNIHLVFLLATYGEGGPTDDCIEFYSKLKSGFLDDVVDENKYLCYSIFGLGSSKYEHFNSISKTFDKTFQSKRIKRVCEYGEGDDAKNISEDFEQWKRKFWMQTYAYFKENREKYTVGIEKLELKKMYEGVKAEIEISLVDGKGLEQNQNSNNSDKAQALLIEDYDFATKRYLQSEAYQIEEIKELRKENINGSTLEISYYSHENSFKYAAADNIGIYPVNSEASVNTVLNRLNYDSNQIVCVKKLKNGELQKKVSIPNGLSVREVLTNILDLSCSINKDLIEKLLKFCYDEDQYDSLQNILKKDVKYNEYIKKNYNIVDFLNVYESINIPFLDFYKIMPKITPRFYTVASSSNLNNKKMNIVISLLSWKGVNGDLRYGLTSNYYKDIYNNFKLGEKNPKFSTKIVIRESSFKLPKSLDTPMIMIATGTGIAPYISFCQEFEYMACNQTAVQRNNVLIFGSKNKQYDYIYEEEINSYVSKSLLKTVYTAFSRDNQSKYYVQDVLLNSKSELEHLLLHEESIIYICGGVSMGAEVVATLEKMLSKEFVKKMENENRLIKELWG